jgi:hypothetical protein
MVSNTTLKNKKMKYVIALLFALTFSKIDAQNLQFSQVLTFSGTTTGNNGISQLGTVPSGKVWKIVSISNLGNYHSIQINNVSVTTGIANASINTYLYLPIWLKDGDQIRHVNYSSSSNSDYFVSIIEFTIVP